AEVQRRGLEGGLDCDFLAHIDEHAERLLAADLGSDLLGPVEVDVGDDHARTLGSQALGYGPADARRRSSDECHPALEGWWGRLHAQLAFLALPVLDAELLGVGHRGVGRER